jgi:hypothetical protein
MTQQSRVELMRMEYPGAENDRHSCLLQDSRPLMKTLLVTAGALLELKYLDYAHMRSEAHEANAGHEDRIVLLRISYHNSCRRKEVCSKEIFRRQAMKQTYFEQGCDESEVAASGQSRVSTLTGNFYLPGIHID